MDCSEKIINGLSGNGLIEFSDDMKQDYHLSDEMIKKLNKLTKAQCESLCYAVDIHLGTGENLEEFLNLRLSIFERNKLANNLNKVKDAISRWDSNLPMSKRDLAFVLGVSQKQIDNLIVMGAPCTQLVEGGKVSFTPVEIKEWLDAKNIRQGD